MKHLQIRVLAIMMTCWCVSIAKDKTNAPAATEKATSSDSSGSGERASEKTQPSRPNKAEIKYKALVEARNAAEATQEKVDSHLRKIRHERAQEVEKERAADKTREKKGRTPNTGDKTAKDSTGAKK